MVMGYMDCFHMLLTFIVYIHFAEAVYPYYGKLIQSGWGSGSTHSLAGDIYAVDGNTFTVRNFKFDGWGDDAAFLLGTNKAYTSAINESRVDPTAEVLRNPVGQMAPLRRYNDETVVLNLPKHLTNYTYIAVGSSSNKHLYGGADIPSDFDAPAPKDIGMFVSRAHSVASEVVRVLNDRMISIQAFRYDGQGPDAYFYVGNTTFVKGQDPPYGIIPDENGISNRKARAYSDKDIVLTLPYTISATNLRWLSMYCVSYAHNFGEVTFPYKLNVPPYIETRELPTENTETTVARETTTKADNIVTEMNCEQLNDDLQVSWSVSADSIVIELAGYIDRNKDYMAFGLSGSDDRISMIGADVFVADWRDGSEPRAVDYYISAYTQCANNGGVCPDDSAFNGGQNDVMMVTGRVTNGITRVKFMRALTTDEQTTSSKDKMFKVDGTEQIVVWAIGPLNNNQHAAKHYAGKRSEGLTKINFMRDVALNCPVFSIRGEKKDKPKFQPHHLYGEEGTVFTVEIGQAASEQGYRAITGFPSWGIAWYVNGILIPELHLKRGVSYTFRVRGGMDPTKTSMYHPLYFTDDVEGGYSQNPNGTIFPGSVNGVDMNYTAIGDYCEWKLTREAVEKAANGYIYQCFEEFKSDLYLDCNNDTSNTAEFVFTPDSSIPDLIYYQCYTHKSLGWKVHIYDELPSERIADVPCSLTNTTIESTSSFTLPIRDVTTSTKISNETSGSADFTRPSIIVLSFVVLMVTT